MKYFKRRALALLLSVCMVLTMMPSMVFAAEPSEEPTGDPVAEAPADPTPAAVLEEAGPEETELAADEITEPEIGEPMPIAAYRDGNGNAGIMPITEFDGSMALKTRLGEAEIVDGVVKLTNNVTINNENVVIKGEVILDLDGHTLTFENDYILACASTTDGTNSLTIRDSGKEGKIVSNGKILQSQNGATVTIEGGTIESTSEEVGKPAVVAMGGSTFNMKNGKITSKKIALQIQDEGSSAIVTDGTIESTDSEGVAAVAATNSSIFTMTGGTIKAAGQGVYVGSTKEEQAKDEKNAVATIGGNAVVECKPIDGVAELQTADYGTLNIEDNAKITGSIAVFENGRLNVSGGEITSKDGFAISTNGSPVGTPNSSAGAQIKISGGKITGTDTACGVYLPAGELTISGDAEITGGAGIVVRGGDLKVTGGTITATSTQNITVGDSGHAVPAAGISVDNAGYPEQAGGQKHVTITEGATVKAPENGKSIAASKDGTEVTPDESEKVKPEESPFDIRGGKLEVNGKSDDENVTQYLPEGYTYESEQITEDLDTIFVAERNGMKYTSLETALASAAAGDTISLLADVSLPGDSDGSKRIEINKKITLDLNGWSLSKSENLSEDKAGLKIVTGGDLTIIDSADYEYSGWITGKGTLLGVFGGSLTLDGCSIMQEKGEDNKNNCAVDIGDGGGTITVRGETHIDAAESGLGASRGGTVNFENGVVDAGIYGIATNGSAQDANAKVNVTGGWITGEKAGMYLPSQNGETTVSGNAIVTGTYGAGIVVRGGSISVNADAEIIAEGTRDQIYGDDTENKLPPAALVVDKTTGYGEGAKAEIFGGRFEAQGTNDAVVLTNGDKEDKENSDEKLKVEGGYFSSPVDKNYLGAGLNTELKSWETYPPYSYYASPSDAKKTDPNGEVTQLNEGKAAIMFAGFIGTDRTDGNEALNNLALEIKGEDQTWGENGINDCDDETLYAAFKAGSGDQSASYTLTFSKDNLDVSESFQGNINENGGGIAYVSFKNHAKDFNPKQGEYKVTLKNGSGTEVSAATINVYQVKYEAGTGVVGNDVTVYTDEDGLVDAKKNHPDGFKLADGMNKWNENKVVEDGYTVTVTLTGYSQPDPTTPPTPPTPGGSTTPQPSTTVNKTNPVNGKFTVSNESAKAGETVKVTPNADEGYVVDQVTVTDKSGKEVTVTENEDGTYSFVMPETAAQPVTVNVTFKKEKEEGGEVMPPPIEEGDLVFSSAAQKRDIAERLTTSKDTSLKLKADAEGVTIGNLAEWDVTSDNPDVVEVLQPSHKLHYVGVGTANVTVKATGSDNKVYSIVIPISVKLGTPTFTLSHASSRKARTFTVTTSTVRGADGFQVKYSLKKSLKSSKTKTYECGKKLNRQTVKANKSKRTYYVRVRAYIVDEDGNITTGAWSKLTKRIVSR